MSFEISEILDSYDLNVRNCGRIRNGFLLDTDCGYKLLREYNKAPEHLIRLDDFRKCLIEAGYGLIDTFFRTREDSLCVEYEDKKYVVMNYFNARECDISNEKEVLNAIKELAYLHHAFDKMNISHEIPIEADCRKIMEKRTRELRRAIAFVRSKKMKNEFELLLNNRLGMFIEDANKAYEIIGREKFDEIVFDKKICHGDYNYHNTLFDKDFVAVITFADVHQGMQCMDLYNFMRKVLEKRGYDMELGEKMFNTYVEHNPLSDDFRTVMAALFIYPEKLWKVVNVYFNSKKSNVYKKNMDKLSMCLSLRENKNAFAMRLLQS